MVFVSAELSRGRGERRSPAPRVALRRRARQEVQYHVLVQAQTARGSSTSWGSARSQTTSWCFMASPDHDVSGRDGDVGPHRHLENQTDHLLFFCHLSSSVAKRYSHASWSLRSPRETCCFARNICSNAPFAMAIGSGLARHYL